MEETKRNLTETEVRIYKKTECNDIQSSAKNRSENGRIGIL
jgi:hypothetical protein